MISAPMLTDCTRHTRSMKRQQLLLLKIEKEQTHLRRKLQQRRDRKPRHIPPHPQQQHIHHLITTRTISLVIITSIRVGRDTTNNHSTTEETGTHTTAVVDTGRTDSTPLRDMEDTQAMITVDIINVVKDLIQ